MPPREPSGGSAKGQASLWRAGEAAKPLPCLRLSGTGDFIAIQVIPAYILTHESAAFMLTHGPACQSETRHKLDFSSVGTGQAMAFDLQPQPLNADIQFQRGRTSAGMPAGQQIRHIGPYKGAVARAHQAFGIGCRGTGMPGLAAGLVNQRATSGIQATARAIGCTQVQ